MSFRLPPLNALRLFEAAGRHLSFKLAAEELNVTPSAVSHGIKSLEDWLGVALFDRGPRGLVLTEAGAGYLPGVREALEKLAAATEALPGRRASGRLSVSVAPSFAKRWLIPNLPTFKESHPDIEVVLDISHRQVDFPRESLDLAIRMGQGDWPGLQAVCLGVESLVPVCAPRLAESIGMARDLVDQTLLHVSSVSEDWAAWASAAGVEGLGFGAVQGLRFDTIDMALDAAAQGAGVAIGRLPLIDADLAAERLVAVLGPPRRVRTGYWLTAGREAFGWREVVAFRDWIQAALGSTADEDG